MSLEIYLFRDRIGVLSLEPDGTIGTLVAKLLDKFHRELNVKCSGSAIVADPPSPCEVSFMLLGARSRYLCSFKLSDLRSNSHVKLSSGIERQLQLFGDAKPQPIADIFYDNVESIHIFTSNHEWEMYLNPFEDLQRQALTCHHNWLKTQDNRYRQENQDVRRKLNDEVQRAVRSRSHVGACRPIVTASTSAGTSSADAYTSTLPVVSGEFMDYPGSPEYEDSCGVRGCGNIEHGYRDRGQGYGKGNGERYGEPSYSSYIPISEDYRSSELESFAQSSLIGNHNPLSGTSDEYTDDGPLYVPVDHQDITFEDYSIALKLDDELNGGFRDRGHEAIKRMIASGIAKDALTGH